ncbi:MAG: AAA family ATPase [Nanoarchaeota archaeon]|nr:AAA family ATPase [Nanoarchaeota archaeon]
MKLKKIKLQNIRSYESQEIEFPDGSVLLSGDIGSGKTSILLGIEFALFGLQPGQRGNSILRNGSDNGGVILEFEIEGKNVLIERTLKRTKSVNQDYCSITIDGVKEELAVTELKSRILELLDYPLELSKKQNLLYKFTVYTPQEEMKQIIIQDAETRVNTLRHVFGIDKYKSIIENANFVGVKLREEKRVKEAMTIGIEEDKEKILEKENELEDKQYNLKSLEKDFFAKTENRKQIQDELDEIKKKLDERLKIHQEIEKTTLMISNKNDTLNSNKRLISQIELQISEMAYLKFDEARIALTKDEIKLLKNKKDELSEKILNLSSEVASLRLKIDENGKVKVKISHLEVCPTCLQDVSPVYKSNVLNKMDSDNFAYANKVKDLELSKIQINKEISENSNKILEKERYLQDAELIKIKIQNLNEKKARLSDINKQNISLDKDIKLLQDHINSLRSSSFELSKYENLFNAKKSALESAVREEKMTEIKCAELKKEIYLFGKQIEELLASIKKIEKIKLEIEQLVRLEAWLTKKFIPVISTIEKNVMARLKSEFSKLFREWFAILVPENFNVLLDDDFTPVIEQHDYELDYSYLSGGERTAIALAYRLSLNQVINSLLSKIKTRDLVILDEPTDGFSETQLDKMRDVLDQLNVGQLIIVSHEQKMESFVENVIKLKKENGKSEIKV